MSEVPWFILSVLCAFCLATADALTKRFFPDFSGWQLVTMRFAAPGLLLAPVAYFNPIPPVPVKFWFIIALLVPFEILAMWLYMVAIRDSPLHSTLPYLAFTPVFNVATGYAILGEQINLQGFAGILLVVLGAYFLNFDKQQSIGLKSWMDPFKAIFQERGSRFMLGVALIYSLNSVLGKQAMSFATPVSFGPFYFISIGSILLVFNLFQAPKSLAKICSRWPQLLITGAFMSIMIVLHFVAIAKVEVAYFVSIKRSSLLFGILYGALLFSEKGLIHHLFAGSLMLTGMGIILFA